MPFSSQIEYNNSFPSKLNKNSFIDSGKYLSNFAKLEITRHRSMEEMEHFSSKYYNWMSFVSYMKHIVSVIIESKENKKRLF